MSQPPQNNVQLTCAACQQSYLINAQFQTTAHQCPHCGVMLGQPPANTQQIGVPQQPLQQQPLQQQPLQQQPLQPGLGPQYQQIGYQQPGSPAAPGIPATSQKSKTVFIIRSVVGGVALIVIVCTIIFIIQKRMNPAVKKEVDLGDFTFGDFNNCGPFEVHPGQRIEVKFLIKTSSGEDAVFDLKDQDEEGAKISESGLFTWTPPNDIGIQTFKFVVHYTDPGKQGSSGHSHMKIKVVDRQK